jgi:hypothetical protein
MNILKWMLSGSFRLAFFGTLKAALFAYMVFVPDTVYASGGAESGGHVDHTASIGAAGNSSNVGIV